MNELPADVLVDHYSHQFVYGCDSVTCKNRFCARCREFIFEGKSRSERCAFAKLCVRNAKERPPMCKNLSYTITNPESVSQLAAFLNLANNFMEGDTSKTKDVIVNLRKIFMNPKLFSLMLLENNDQLNSENSAINDDFFVSFASKLSSSRYLDAALLDCVHTAGVSALERNSTFPDLRALIILFYFPSILSPQCSETLLKPLLTKISHLPTDSLEIVKSWLAKLPKLLGLFIGAVHFSLLLYFASHANPDPHNPAIVETLEALTVAHSANEYAEHPLPPSVFYNHHIDEAVKPEEELMLAMRRSSGEFALLSVPFVLSIKTKAQICQFESQQLMGAMAIHSMFMGAIHSTRSNDLFLTIRVRRSHLLDDAVTQLSTQNPLAFLKKLKVVFEGESAVDVGGPSREFLYLIAERLFSPDFSMFVVVNERFNWFSPVSFEGERSYFLVGAVVGIAIHNNVVLPIRFPLLVYKRLMTPNRKLTLTDLAEIDPQLAQSLRQIQDMVAKGEDVSELGLTFDASIDCWGEPKTVPLHEGMSGIEVTNENAQFYIMAYIRFLLVRLIEPRFEAFRRGFELGTKATTYRLLEPAEIDILVSGEEVMDWGALQRCAKYADGYSRRSRAVKWFWDIFSSFPHEKKLKFLKFATGTDRSPLGGLGNVKLIVQRGADPNRLPISHTCFNTFTLPDYSSKSTMRKKITMAIEQTEGFGIV